MSLVDVKKTETLAHPYEEGVTVDIRRLRGTEMDEASNAKVKRTMAVWGDSLEALSKTKNLTGVDTAVNDLETRVKKYDPTVLLQFAITGWSYDEPATSEAIDRLDSLTRDWLVEEVVKRNTRPLPSSKSGADISSQDSVRPS